MSGGVMEVEMEGKLWQYDLTWQWSHTLRKPAWRCQGVWWELHEWLEQMCAPEQDVSVDLCSLYLS